jgi:Cysteine-rich secretory protein family
MFHVKKLVLLIVSLYSLHGYSQGFLTLQDKPFEFKHAYDTALLHQLEANSFYKELTVNEKELFYWTNYFRQNPKRFYEQIVKEFLYQFPEAKSGYSRSLEADIQKAPTSLPLFIPDNGLLKTSKEHAMDLAKRGNIISHNSSNGKSFSQRLQDEGKYTCGAENIYIGSNKALESLITLLIDNGVPDKGHRMNLLEPRYGRMGVSFQSAGSGKGLLVQDFSCP